MKLILILLMKFDHINIKWEISWKAPTATRVSLMFSLTRVSTMKLVPYILKRLMSLQL